MTNCKKYKTCEYRVVMGGCADNCISYEEVKTVTREEILKEAIKCVCGDRDEQYGKPEESFEAIAELWNAYLIVSGLATNEVTATDVAAMMVLFKIGRIATGQSKLDNWIDLAGYAACGGEVQSNG